MSESTTIAPAELVSNGSRVRVGSLSILALMGFVLVAMETMPAGLLPVMADSLGTSEGNIGLFVSAYALGTVIVTIPAISLTQKYRRKPLLLIGIAGLATANLVTAFSPEVPLSLASRFVAGAFSGAIWGMLAPYGLKITPRARAGVALAIVSVGAPLGFAFGTPLGAWIGLTFDWRWSFVGLSVIALAVGLAVIFLVPDAPGQRAAAHLPLARVFRLPGVAIVLAVIFLWMLAHSTIYTYMAPYLRITGTGIELDAMFLVYGVASLVGVVVTGLLLDRYPRPLLHGTLTVFVMAGVVLLVGHSSSAAVLTAAVLWGVGFGGAAAQMQAALSRAGGESSDVANSFLPVAFNLAIFSAGILGAGLLKYFDGLVLAVMMIALGLAALALTFRGRRTAFVARY